MKTIKKLKQTLKKNAHYIRELKSKRKESQNGYVDGLGQAQMEYRIGQIAYCLIRGRTPEQIENKHRDDDQGYVEARKYAWKEAEKLKARLEEEIANETLCLGS